MAECHSIERAGDVIGAATWTPVIYFADGRVKHLDRALSHAAAMLAAERESEQLEKVESFGAQRDGLRCISARALSDQ